MKQKAAENHFTAPPGLVRPKQAGHTTLSIILYIDGGAKTPSSPSEAIIFLVENDLRRFLKLR